MGPVSNNAGFIIFGGASTVVSNLLEADGHHARRTTARASKQSLKTAATGQRRHQIDRH